MKGKQIKTLRQRLKWSQEQLADYLGYGDRGSVSHIEKGRYGVGGAAVKLLYLARRLGKDVVKLWDKRYEKRIKEAIKDEPDEQKGNADND